MLKMDGTENKSKYGANAILGISMAATKAGAAAKGMPLYRHIADIAGNKDVLLPVPVRALQLSAAQTPPFHLLPLSLTHCPPSLIRLGGGEVLCPSDLLEKPPPPPRAP